MIVTGGAGFIGYHAARHYTRLGWQVTVLDNLSRRGSAINYEALQKDGIDCMTGDIRSVADLDRCFQRTGRVDAVVHLAAQVAVTTSVTDPRNDFEVNALGTLLLLQAARQAGVARFLYMSTSEVYGRARAYVAGDDTRRAADAAELRTILAGLLEVGKDRFHIDGAYDKMLYKLTDPAFPLRLLPPYVGATDEEFSRFRALLPPGWRQ